MLKTFRIRNMLAQRARRAAAERIERPETIEASREAARRMPPASVAPFGEPLEGVTTAGGWA